MLQPCSVATVLNVLYALMKEMKKNISLHKRQLQMYFNFISETQKTDYNLFVIVSPHVAIGVRPQVPGPRDSCVHTPHYPSVLGSK